MNLKLAIALSCTDTACQVQYPDCTDSIEAVYSQPVVAHSITIRTGDLVAIDCLTDPPRVVYRLVRATVLGVEGDEIIAATPSGNHQLTRADGLDTPIAVDSEVFFDRGRVCDVSQGGYPANPDRLRATLFPEIRALYRRLEE